MKMLLDDPPVYKKLAENPLSDMQTEFNKGLTEICKKYDNVKDRLKSFNSRLPSLPYMYGLPKIHKENVPYRPIISNVNSPSVINLQNGYQNNCLNPLVNIQMRTSNIMLK